MKNSAFPTWIRKLGVKKCVLLSIFALVALAYIVTPLIALACDGGKNNGKGGNSSSDAANGGRRSPKNPTPTPTPKPKSKKPKKNSLQIDTGILLINKHSIQPSKIAFFQVVGPDHKALTLSQYQQLVQYAATPGKGAILVRIEIVLFNQPILNGVFTQGQFLTKLSGNQPTGEIILTTDDKQKITASPTTPIPLRIPGSKAQQKQNGVRRP